MLLDFPERKLLVVVVASYRIAVATTWHSSETGIVHTDEVVLSDRVEKEEKLPSTKWDPATFYRWS